MKVEFQRFDSFDIAKRCNPLDIAESCSLHLIEYVLILVFFCCLSMRECQLANRSVEVSSWVGNFLCYNSAVEWRYILSSMGSCEPL